MKPAEAEALFELLCDYYAKSPPEKTRAVWLGELRTVAHDLGSAAVRSLVVGCKFFPSIAEFYEQVEIAREQATRRRREQERREADAALDAMERLPLDAIRKRFPEVEPWMPGSERVAGLPEEGKGVCSDCGEERPRLFRLGKVRVCSNCAPKRLVVRMRLGDEENRGFVA